MRLIGGVILLLALLAGCAGQPPPAMPKFTTEKQKVCARTCQATYAQCNSGCSQMVGGLATVGQRGQCLKNCNQTLGDCYSTCD